jgi:hypothetical protein
VKLNPVIGFIVKTLNFNFVHFEVDQLLGWFCSDVLRDHFFKLQMLIFGEFAVLKMLCQRDATVAQKVAAYSCARKLASLLGYIPVDRDKPLKVLVCCNLLILDLQHRCALVEVEVQAH